MPTAPVAVRLEGVEKRYGDVVAVDGIDLDVRDGEFFSMLGPSGSGKTTMLRMIAGFELPTAGRVLLHGRGRHDGAAVRPRREHGLPGLRAVPPHDGRRQRRVRADGPQGRQGRARHPRHRGAPDGPARGVRGAQAEPALGRPAPAGRARPGARQPAAGSSCSTSRSGALDLKLREEMQIELKAIQQQVGITFIYVTHDQEEALTMSDRLAVFNRGRIEQVGAPADVYEQPATRFVAGFVGTSNLLTRRRRAGGRRDGRHLHDPAREDPAGRARHRGRRPTRSRPTAGSATSSTSAPTPATSSPRRRGRARRHPPEPRHVVDGGARPGRQGCPPDLEATARTPRRGRGVTPGGGGTG